MTKFKVGDRVIHVQKTEPDKIRRKGVVICAIKGYNSVEVSFEGASPRWVRVEELYNLSDRILKNKEKPIKLLYIHGYLQGVLVKNFNIVGRHVAGTNVSYTNSAGSDIEMTIPAGTLFYTAAKTGD